MRHLWKPLAGTAAVLFTLVLLASLLRPPDPNAEMAETAGKAVEMAQDARQDAESARRRAYAIRVVALVTGVAVPLVVAYLIYRLSEQSEPGPEDVLEVMEDEELVRDVTDDKPSLTTQGELKPCEQDTSHPDQTNS